MKTKDGQGNEIVDEVEYFVQDARAMVGNCMSWWAPNGAGYVCDIREAGRYLGKDVHDMRETDVPWLCSYVEPKIVHHVRGDVQVFRRKDQPLRELTPTRRRR